MTTVENGNTVSVHYVGTFEDGTEFDSSHNRDKPLTFEVGSGQMIPGFDSALPGMSVGEKKQLTLTPDKAYGSHNPEATQVFPKNVFPKDFVPVVDATVAGQNPEGSPMMAKITAFDTHTITLDLNHPMAGKTLNFEIELLQIA
tara:strand:+ start:148 stop:579 length:432 start_codon:yes stop_codon:yes gene_type:complete